jgi:PhoPQ-activated pathogenicity-related protein
MKRKIFVLQHLSLYYGNHRCDDLEPYYEDDVIGRYTADNGEVGRTSGDVNDNLDQINSVSVRRASDFTLLACADVHPSY